MISSSTPSLTKFNPHDVPYQFKVIKDIRENFIYEMDVEDPDTGEIRRDRVAHEVLLSGSVGSAKSLLMAHIIVTHCMMYNGARFCIGRQAMPDLKATLFQKIWEHIRDDLKEGEDYYINHQTAYIRFKNGSEIISRSWADRHYTKARSLELSGMAIEEGTENEAMGAYTEFSMRVNRLPHIPEQLVIMATNPDSPSHWIHKHFMEKPSPTRHVYYSVTTDNKFLPPSYIKKLEEDLDPKTYERMVLGKWIDISGETIYHQWDAGLHWVDDFYEVDLSYPVHVSWDFNVGEGKPMSVIFGQYIGDTFHYFTEAVVQGLRTETTLIECEERGIWRIPTPYFYLTGDASGTAHSANSEFSNYEIIETYFKKKNIRYEYQVPHKNPPIKTRHTDVNGYLKNFEGRVRLKVYSKACYEVNGKRYELTGCPKAKEGLALTKLKKGGQYIEDDSKDYQHVTTAIGYDVSWVKLNKDIGRSFQAR